MGGEQAFAKELQNEEHFPVFPSFLKINSNWLLTLNLCSSASRKPVVL